MQLSKKVRIGKVVAPLWAVGLTGAALAAVAGTAVGPVLTGSVSGVIGATVAQTIVLDAAPVNSTLFGSALVVTGADDSIGVVNDEGTSFTYAFETQVGQNQVMKLSMDNQSGQDANAIMELIVPAGIDVEVEESSGSPVSEAQLNSNRWLLSVPNNGGDIDVLIEPKDDLKPGFYTITGRIVQIAG